MKKVLIVAATAGLMSLAACTPAATNNTTTENVTEEANTLVYDEAANVAVENSAPVVETTNTTDMNMSNEM